MDLASIPPTLSHFLRLPAELRNYVYELSLYPEEGSTRHRKNDTGGRRFASRSLNGYCSGPYYKPPRLLSVSRQIRGEASIILYTKTDFFQYHCNMEALASWLDSLTPVDEELVQSIKCGEREALYLNLFEGRRWNELRRRNLSSFDFKEIVEVAVFDSSEELEWKYKKAVDVVQTVRWY